MPHGAALDRAGAPPSPAAVHDDHRVHRVVSAVTGVVVGVDGHQPDRRPAAAGGGVVGAGGRCPEAPGLLQQHPGLGPGRRLLQILVVVVLVVTEPDARLVSYVGDGGDLAEGGGGRGAVAAVADAAAVAPVEVASAVPPPSPLLLLSVLLALPSLLRVAAGL